MAFILTLDGVTHQIEIIRRRPRLVLSVDGRLHDVATAGDFGDGRQNLTIDGVEMRFTRARLGDIQFVRLGRRDFEIIAPDPRSVEAAASGAEDFVKAPMPGVVVSIHAKVGEAVKKGATLVTIESMKLQIALSAPRDGVIAQMPGGAGERFEKDSPIIRLEPIVGGV